MRDGDVHVDALPDSDPAYPIVNAISRVVPASRWAYARVGSAGSIDVCLASDRNSGERFRLESEFKRQRMHVKTGPRLAAALGPLGAYESGITLLFADAQRTFGILTLLRTAALGPFTPTEVTMLAFALSAASDRFSGLRLQPHRSKATKVPSVDADMVGSQLPAGAFYVLDREMQIVLAWNSEDQQRIALTDLRSRVADRLPALLEDTVRELTASWGVDPNTQQAGIARPVPFLVVSTHPLSGPTGLFIGVRVDRFRQTHSLTGAATRFLISPREVEVLSLLLDGATIDEMGRRLFITPSTVQDHIRNMVEKTGTKNRSELIARMLGWESTPAAPRTYSA